MYTGAIKLLMCGFMFYIGVKVCVYLMVNAQIKLFESRLHFTINWTGNTNQF